MGRAFGRMAAGACPTPPPGRDGILQHEHGIPTKSGPSQYGKGGAATGSCLARVPGDFEHGRVLSNPHWVRLYICSGLPLAFFHIPLRLRWGERRSRAAIVPPLLRLPARLARGHNFGGRVFPVVSRLSQFGPTSLFLARSARGDGHRPDWRRCR